MSNAEVLTLREASLYLKVSQESLRTLIKDRKIPVARVGTQYRFQKRLIDLWLKLQALRSYEDPDGLMGEESRFRAMQILSDSSLPNMEKQLLMQFLSKSTQTRPSPDSDQITVESIDQAFLDELEEAVIL
ncbi:helix-turn-helix domain-containing protein [bacterium]|jgi:excisionase family DNA binding protein|nr:helix-turn-helix domain-containing protein [bacterium]